MYILENICLVISKLKKGKFNSNRYYSITLCYTMSFNIGVIQSFSKSCLNHWKNNGMFYRVNFNAPVYIALYTYW